MDRRTFVHDGLTFSYVDFGGDGAPVVALHAHWMEGVTWASLADALAPTWRVFALDQRGHGHSSHAPSYTRDDYVRDVAAFLDHLGLASAVLVGHSLGGVNAFQLAARAPDRARALVIEDIGDVVQADMRFVLQWEGTFPSREALGQRVGPRLFPYLQDSVRETPEGFRLAFEPREMLVSQQLINGDHSADWAKTACPALVVGGRRSPVTPAKALEEMVARRPGAELVMLDGGHVVHADCPEAFAAAVRRFLDRLEGA